jgi:ABC-type Na+ efflux pump permease subunit
MRDTTLFLGPVCHFELVRIARRGRLFTLRFLFGLLLLGIITANYLGHFGASQSLFGTGTQRQMAGFGQVLFGSIIAALAILVLALTPALAADAIASERQRKTLEYLLASRLASHEIVLGKLAARLINVAVYPALILPVVSLLTLIGGVSPAVLILAYVTVTASAYFLTALALLASVLSRRTRDAVGSAYLLTAAWLFMPALLELWLSLLPPSWLELRHIAEVVASWVWPANPLELAGTAARSGGSADLLARDTLWLTGSLAFHGTLISAIAIWQLRPAFRRHEGRAGQPSRIARHVRRWWPVRPCGDDPVFWKEAFFTPATGGLGSRIVRIIMYSVLGLMVVGILIASWGAFQELLTYGYGAGSTQQYEHRMMLNIALRYGGALAILIWLLSLAGQAAAGITAEREQDTWTSLLATPLEGREILRGKMLGPLRATAPVGAAIGTVWLIGTAVGSVHPLGLINAALVLGLLIWFALALGTHRSLHAKGTWQARLWAQGILIAPNVCCLLPIPSPGMLAGLSLWSYVEIQELPNALSQAEALVILLLMAYYLAGIAVYGGAASLRPRRALRGFDAVADRPRRAPGDDVVLLEIPPAPAESP